MSETDSGSLKCPRCLKDFHAGRSHCPDDGFELVPVITPDPLLGTIFAEKYEILSLLGEGGMSKVYKARHRLMKRIVAVKLLHESATKDPTAKARFQQEAEAASALSHQNVVTVHDFGFTPSGQAFFVMDCLEGKTLEQIIAEGSIPLNQAIEIFAQGCDALEHAHRKGIVHRDIKPSNLVVIKQEDGSNLVKVVDFGIAKVLTPPSTEETQRQLTQAGEVFGTPAYMSPEQCSGDKLDGRSDLYSFGCMMYEALSGQPPLMGETFINTVVKHINERPRSISEVAPNSRVPAPIEAVVMKCLEKKPRDRYATALELKQALIEAAQASNVTSLRIGSAQDAKINTTKSQVLSTSLTVQLISNRWRLNFVLTLSIVAVIFITLGTILFGLPGPDGNTGTLFNKMIWQRHLAQADDLLRQQKYDEAVKQLELARDVSKGFGDGNSRLEITLNRLGEAYGLARQYAEQETVNGELAELLRQRVLTEYSQLMEFLQQWETPSSSSTKTQELVLQASAFADRIVLCADRLSIHEQEKEERLLKKAIEVFDSIETGDWKTPVRFRVTLAEAYHQQQRFDDEKAILKQAVLKSVEKPVTPEGWRAKIKAMMHLGQLDRNEAVTIPEMDHARKELESALDWTKSSLPMDRELLRESINSMVIMCRLYHTKQYEEKAVEYEKQVKAIDRNDGRHG